MQLTDITDEFLQACKDIPPGTLVKASSLHMLDAMNALTILDPRMDTGVRQSAVGERVPLQREVDGREVCAVVDRLVQNEMAFHAGWPLVPTVFTSRHLLELDTLRSIDDDSTSLLRSVLIPYVEAYNTSLAYAWQELARGAVFEGEDWLGDMAGREDWEVGEVEGVTSEAVDGLEGIALQTRLTPRPAVDPDLKQQLHLRLAIRQSFLTLLATTISGGTPPPDESTSHLISQLQHSTDASTLSAPFFDPDVPRRFRQAMPVPTVTLPSAARAYVELGGMMDGLRWVGEVRDWAVRPWLEARERQAWVFAMGPGSGEACWSPLVRSCMTWSIIDGFIYPLQQAVLVSQWMRAYAADGQRQEFDLDRVLYRASAESIERLVEVRRFFDMLSENIRLDLHDRCQNRARQHRLYTVSAQRWQDLGALLPRPGVIDAVEHGQLVRGISARRADALLDALLASLDLELIETEEWSQVYWFMWRVAEDGEMGDVEPRTWRTSWARAWAYAARGIHFAFSGTISPNTETNPHGKAVFHHRFAPFQPRSSPTGNTVNFRTHTYEEYTKSCSAIRDLSAETLRKQVESSFNSAAKAFASVHRQLETEQVGPGEQQQKSDETHKVICKYLERTVAAYVAAEKDERLDPDLRCSKWLPPVQDMREGLQCSQR